VKVAASVWLNVPANGRLQVMLPVAPPLLNGLRPSVPMPILLGECRAAGLTLRQCAEWVLRNCRPDAKTSRLTREVRRAVVLRPVVRWCRTASRAYLLRRVVVGWCLRGRVVRRARFRFSRRARPGFPALLPPQRAALFRVLALLMRSRRRHLKRAPGLSAKVCVRPVKPENWRRRLTGLLPVPCKLRPAPLLPPLMARR
jgi:hypothetical protein